MEDNYWEQYFNGICPYTDERCEFGFNCKHCNVEMREQLFEIKLQQEAQQQKSEDAN